MYKPLHRVLNVIYSRHGAERIEMTGSDGEAVMVDPTRLSNLPNLLRNSLAHFNILPINNQGRFAGNRIWNRDWDKQITFVADVDFDEMRSLARHVLNVLRAQQSDLNLRDSSEHPTLDLGLIVRTQSALMCTTVCCFLLCGMPRSTVAS